MSKKRIRFQGAGGRDGEGVLDEGDGEGVDNEGDGEGVGEREE